MRYTNMAVVFLFFLLGGWTLSEGAPAPISKEIYVNPKGGDGVFTSIQDAINQGIPEHNNEWVLVHVAAGVYTGYYNTMVRQLDSKPEMRCTNDSWFYAENVTILPNKQYVYLKGEGSSNTIVAWKSTSWSLQEAVLMVTADNFIAQGISFKNTLNVDSSTHENGVMPAVAADVKGDKNSFYGCGFIGRQDTLYDESGRHLFQSCYIEGAVDFIFGDGTSMYQACLINVTGYGYVTAQKRQLPDSESGFVFKNGIVTGTGPAFLGRAYGPYSRVVYYKCNLSAFIQPKGWDAWNFQGNESQLTYAEVDCKGDGANTTQRVPWVKSLSRDELKSLIDVSFVDKEGWIENQPVIL